MEGWKMAKKHYIIEAKGAEYISGNKITIEDLSLIHISEPTRRS